MAFHSSCPTETKTALIGMWPTSVSDAELKARGWLEIGSGRRAGCSEPGPWILPCWPQCEGDSLRTLPALSTQPFTQWLCQVLGLGTEGVLAPQSILDLPFPPQTTCATQTTRAPIFLWLMTTPKPLVGEPRGSEMVWCTLGGSHFNSQKWSSAWVPEPHQQQPPAQDSQIGGQ